MVGLLLPAGPWQGMGSYPGKCSVGRAWPRDFMGLDRAMTSGIRHRRTPVQRCGSTFPKGLVRNQGTGAKPKKHQDNCVMLGHCLQAAGAGGRQRGPAVVHGPHPFRGRVCTGERGMPASLPFAWLGLSSFRVSPNFLPRADSITTPKLPCPPWCTPSLMGAPSESKAWSFPRM